MPQQKITKNYDMKVDVALTTDYGLKVQTYSEAIKIKPTVSTAYIKLLDAYRDNNKFGVDESNEFISLYNANKDDFTVKSNDYLDLNYAIGEIYWGSYVGETDDSFRQKVIKAYPYFKNVVDNAAESYTNLKMAKSYYIVGDFYKNYVVESTNVKEPSLDNYTQLLGSLKECIENIDNYNSSDIPYIKLTMYLEISNLLNDHRRGFASTGIPEESLTELLTLMKDKAASVAATQQQSIEKQEQIAEQYPNILDSIKTTYQNVKERS